MSGNPVLRTRLGYFVTQKLLQAHLPGSGRDDRWEVPAVNRSTINPLRNKGLRDTTKLCKLGLRANYFDGRLNCRSFFGSGHGLNISGAYLKDQAPLLEKCGATN